jgi:hypothetical protein
VLDLAIVSGREAGKILQEAAKWLSRSYVHWLLALNDHILASIFGDYFKRLRVRLYHALADSTYPRKRQSNQSKEVTGVTYLLANLLSQQKTLDHGLSNDTR